MADFDLSTITGALSQAFRDRVVRTFNATSTLLKVLPIERGAGKNCAWDVEGTGAIGENFSDGADVSNYGTDVPHAATLSWGLYRSNFKITNLARSAARSSQSPRDLMMPMGRSLVNSSRKLASSINDELFNGLGTGTLIAGLDVALDDSNTYAGLSRSTEAYVRAKVFEPGVTTAPTFQLLRKDLFDIKDICGEMPDLAFVDSAGFLKIAALFDSSRRWDLDLTINTARGSVVLDASVGKVQIEGCTYIQDKDATSASLYYLNSNYVHVEYLPSADEEQLPEDMIRMGMEDGYGPLPLGMNVYPLARTGAARKVTAEVQVQLVVAKPTACGIRKHLG